MKDPLDLQLVNGIGRVALEEVLSGFLMLDATGSDAPTDSELATIQDWLVGTVSLQAERRTGWVRITLPESLATRAATHLFGPGLGDPADLVGEFTNLIAGRIASGLAGHGVAFTLHTPTVQRLGTPPEPHPGLARSHWRFWDHPLTLDILVTEHTT